MNVRQLFLPQALQAMSCISGMSLNLRASQLPGALWAVALREVTFGFLPIDGADEPSKGEI